MFSRRRHHPGLDETVAHVADPVVTVTDANFEIFVIGGPSVIDFHAPWCGPCRQLAPTFDHAATHHAELLRFGRCDVDQNPRTAARLNIMSIPTIVRFDTAGRELDRLVGAPGARQLDAFLSAVTPGAA